MYSGKAGIAIKSTVGRLKSALSDERPFYIAPVTYLDFETEGDSKQISFGTFIAPFLKRKSFEHEQEVRVVMMGAANLEGHEFACDIPTLVERIYLSPESDDWLKPHIELLLEKFGLGSIPVEKSPLYAKQSY
jgi:hypothetical protein